MNNRSDRMGGYASEIHFGDPHREQPRPSDVPRKSEVARHEHDGIEHVLYHVTGGDYYDSHMRPDGSPDRNLVTRRGNESDADFLARWQWDVDHGVVA